VRRIIHQTNLITLIHSSVNKSLAYVNKLITYDNNLLTYDCSYPIYVLKLNHREVYMINLTENVQAIKALIFDIQKFSVNDGPGIRTVVFFKGCPLRCKWCSNPEGQGNKIQVLWNKEKCLSYGTCEEVCPQKAIDLSPGNVFIKQDACDGCGICVTSCRAHALSLAGTWKTVEEVLQVCSQDLPFYEESGGGITLSGGDPLFYPDFSIALLTSAHAEGIHTAMETTGYASREVFDRVTAHPDLLLFDMKHWDEGMHIQGTGVSNRLILDNMKRAVECGKNILPRIPVIPGYNDALSDAEGFCQRLKDVGLTRVQLLPFHRFGENKYSMLGRDYDFSDSPALHAEDLETYQQVFQQNKIEAFF
jgi:pyruvate formate lyase activating enzyme